MKIILVNENGSETLVCESIDVFHGSLTVKLLNGNYATKVRKVEYKLVDLDYDMQEDAGEYVQSIQLDMELS